MDDKYYVKFPQKIKILIILIFCITFSCINYANAEVDKKNNSIVENTNNISLYFQSIDIRTLLQLISKKSGFNFVISDSVKGSISLSLKNVTWQQALNVILQSKGLSSSKTGNVLYISTLEEITENFKKKLEAEKELNSAKPLKTSVIPLKYSDAKVVKEMLQGQNGSSLISSRGQVTFDLRTNTLIVSDTPKNIQILEKTIKKLDMPARQVSIEARIISLDTSFEDQLGVRLGFSRGKHFSGTLTGANQLAQGTSAADVAKIDDRLNFNLPANKLSTGSVPASIGLALARLGQVMLDLELSALESEGYIQIISKPRVVASNQQKAIIQTGEEIPYQEATSSGATSVSFKKAVLSLEVIPLITPNNKIMLNLRASQDTRGEQLLVSPGIDSTSTSSTTVAAAVYGPPTINTQMVESSILLNNNETFVVGGVFKLTKQNKIDRVPFLGKLPVLGHLFTHKGQQKAKTELLIFITPKIIEPSSAMSAYKG